MRRYLGRPVAATALAVTLIGAAPARADVISIVGGPGITRNAEGLGSFSGSIGYEYRSGVGTLTIELENTSPASNGGEIAGFLFNIRGDAMAAFTSATLVGDARSLFWSAASGGLGATSACP